MDQGNILSKNIQKKKVLNEILAVLDAEEDEEDRRGRLVSKNFRIFNFAAVGKKTQPEL